MNILSCFISFSLIQGNETFPCYMVTISWLQGKIPHNIGKKEIWTCYREIVFSISDFPCYREIMTVVPNTIFFWCEADNSEYVFSLSDQFVGNGLFTVVTQPRNFRSLSKGRRKIHDRCCSCEFDSLLTQFLTVTNNMYRIRSLGLPWQWFHVLH